MAQLLNKDRFGGILKTSTLLIFLGTFGIVVLGTSLIRIHNEIKKTDLFLDISQNIQTDFERSLLIYTENTAQDVEYIHSLRPETELEYISFISTVEELAQSLGLSIDLETVDLKETKVTTGNIQSDSISYQVSFYGNNQDMISFLSELENIPYYTQITNITYKDINSMDFRNDIVMPNVTLTIKLYVK